MNPTPGPPSRLAWIALKRVSVNLDPSEVEVKKDKDWFTFDQDGEEGEEGDEYEGVSGDGHSPVK